MILYIRKATYIQIVTVLMTSKTINKKLLIDRIWKDTKYEVRQTKDSLTSSAITQSSPNDGKTENSFMKNFFTNFQDNCSIKHRTVPAQHRPPLFRNLKP